MSALALTIEPCTEDENSRANEFTDLLEQSLRTPAGWAESLKLIDTLSAWHRVRCDDVRKATGIFDATDIREAAVFVKLSSFLGWCIDNKEDLAVMIRAKAHQQQRRR